MHPYDGVERRFRHTDADRNTRLDLIAQLLHLPKPPAGDDVLYDLSFYSGGIGVLDNLAITLAADPAIWASVTTVLAARTPEEAVTDPGWADDFVWLLTGEEAQVSAREAAVQFINSERRDFQSACDATSRILFVDASDVNSWVALWGDDATLNYRSYDQG